MKDGHAVSTPFPRKKRQTRRKRPTKRPWTSLIKTGKTPASSRRLLPSFNTKPMAHIPYRTVPEPTDNTKPQNQPAPLCIRDGTARPHEPTIETLPCVSDAGSPTYYSMRSIYFRIGQNTPLSSEKTSSLPGTPAKISIPNIVPATKQSHCTSSSVITIIVIPQVTA